MHALFARCADLESLTEGPMMFPGRAEQLLHGGRDGAGREQQPAGLLAARGMKAHFFFGCARMSDSSHAAMCS